jgi:hypothetical protein
LVAVIGMNRASPCAAFADKRDLHLRTLSAVQYQSRASRHELIAERLRGHLVTRELGLVER